MNEKQWQVMGKVLVSGLVCGLGAVCLYLTEGKAGFGWTVIGLFIVWSS